MPEAIQIYVCADNCMRGVVLTAAEMNAADRFSFVTVEEENLLNGNLEDVTIEGVTDVLNKLEEKPKAVLLFTVCLHHFLGCDLDRVYEELGTRFPEIVFVRCFMDPIMQKHGLTPDQKLRKAMYDPLIPKESDPQTVTLVGSDFALDESSDIKRLLRSTGHTLRELPACKTWEEYQQLGSAGIFVSCYPPAKYGADMLAERLNRTHLYLPGSFDYGEIKEEIRSLIKELQAGWSREDTSNTKCADITSEEIEAFYQTRDHSLRRFHQPRKIHHRRYPGRSGLSVPPKTIRSCKTSSGTRFPCNNRLPRQHKSGRKAGLRLAETSSSGPGTACHDPNQDACPSARDRRQSPCHRTESRLVFRQQKFRQYGTGRRLVGLRRDPKNHGTDDRSFSRRKRSRGSDRS